MQRSKAAGWDDMPIEYFKDSETLKREIFELVQQMWETEEIPEEIVRGVFVPIYKNKGDKDDPGKYRFICLLTHSLQQRRRV